MVSSDNPSFGNLKNNLRNPQAARTNLRQGRLSNPQLSLGTGLKSGGLVFDAMMAVNESQNQVINQVLEGPVSQQTQRQLAQLKTLSSQNPELNNLAQTGRVPGSSGAKASEAEEAAFDDPRKGALAAGGRIFGNLQGGRTLRKGVETGKIFSPAQLTSFRKKNGLLRVEPTPVETKEPTKPASLADLAALAADPANASPILSGAVAVTRPAMSESELNQKTNTAQATKKEGAQPPEKINGIINKVAEALGLDPSLIKAVVKTESNFNQKAISRAGAKGLMQLMPTTAKEMGVSDPFNPFENIWGGARYLKKMLDRHGGDLNQALAAYNWGPGNLERHGSSRMPGETRRYIEVVNRNYARFKKESQMA
ncbi:MAG: lytic transglycosylase domain-containing protein [Deltaproteobacteria bacterium]|nr:lytic transglycosylase domain-containing protein [Deltaproteobacteria bacterium]